MLSQQLSRAKNFLPFRSVRHRTGYEGADNLKDYLRL